MPVLVGNTVVRAELKVVMSNQSDDVRKEIATLEGKVLENEVQRITRILDTRDWEIPNLYS